MKLHKEMESLYGGWLLVQISWFGGRYYLTPRGPATLIHPDTPVYEWEEANALARLINSQIDDL